MAYDNIISRTDAAGVIPEDFAKEIIKSSKSKSAARSLFREKTLSRNQQRLPVQSALATAYFVNGDTGLKQTTEVDWTNVYLNVEEIACVVPIPENVFDDVDFDIWEEIKPDIEEAVGIALDTAIFFGTNKPASWPTDIVTAAVAAGNTATRGTNTQAQGGIAGDIADVMGTIESDGYDATGFVAARSIKGALRKSRDTTGQKLMDVSPTSIEGVEIQYPMRGFWPTGSGSAQLIGGDFTQGILGVRQDLSYKVLDQAVIQDNTGAIIYNLAQQDMLALRVKARFAFAVPNPINRDNPTAGTRYPFGVLRAA